MDLEVGSILAGKVTGITNFGAFVTVAPGKSGLVHISEISNTYVNNVRDHLTEGQEVKVKVIGIDQNGRVNLSIKATLPPPTPRTPRGDGFRRTGGGQRPAGNRPQNASAPQSGSVQRNAYRASQPVPPAETSSGNEAFDDMLKRFMQDSDSKISGLYTEKKSRRRNNNRN